MSRWAMFPGGGRREAAIVVVKVIMNVVLDQELARIVIAAVRTVLDMIMVASILWITIRKTVVIGIVAT